MRFKRNAPKDRVDGRLALNEHRAPFSPTLWKWHPQNKGTKVLKQVWFPGVHCSVGGGDDTASLSVITMAWMVEQIHHYTNLECDITYLRYVLENLKPSPLDQPWGTARWTRSDQGIFRLSGKKRRTPGKYHLGPNEKTFEYVHKSVNERLKRMGKDYHCPDVSHLEEDHFGEVERKLAWIAEEKRVEEENLAEKEEEK